MSSQKGARAHTHTNARGQTRARRVTRAHDALVERHAHAYTQTRTDIRARARDASRARRISSQKGTRPHTQTRAARVTLTRARVDA